MKKSILTLTIGIFCILTLFASFVNAENSLWNSINVDRTEGTVTYHVFHSVEDTSARGIVKNKDIPMILWYEVQSLPLTLDSGNQIDWCELNISHYHNIYGTNFVAFQGFYGGDLLNTTIETQNFLFTSGTSGQITINMRDRDSITADMKCHYVNNTNLYENNILAGRITTYLSSYECDGCTQYSLEEITNQADKVEQIAQNELSIYNTFQKLIDWNFQIWLIVSWILKIGFILVGIGLIFAGIYYFYVFLQNIARDI